MEARLREVAGFIFRSEGNTVLFKDEVERLLRDYTQNQELLRRLGNRYYQVVYPIQVSKAVQSTEYSSTAVQSTEYRVQ